MNKSNDLQISNEKQVYDIIKRLMKLADKNENEEFMSIVNENYQKIFNNLRFQKINPDTIITSGLIARNKTELLNYFLEKLDAENFLLNETDITAQLIGTLILEKKNTEAINCFLEKEAAFWGFLELEYIFTAIIATDNLTLFKTVYKTYKDTNMYLGNAFFSAPYRINILPFELAVLEGVIFGSKNILDFVTDNGHAFRHPAALKKVNFLKIQELSYAYREFYFQYHGRCLPEVCWLEKLYSMYFKNESPQNAYNYLMSIAEKINIMPNNSNSLFENKSSASRLLQLEISRICGMKTNDLSFIAYYCPDYPSDCINPEYIAKLLNDVSGQKPYVDFIASEFGIKTVDNIILFADKIQTKLTVRLIYGFDSGYMNELRDKVRFELDISDWRTENYLRDFFDIPPGTHLKAGSSEFEMIAALIGEKLITPQKLVKLINTVNCPDIVNFLFNYNNTDHQ